MSLQADGAAPDASISRLRQAASERSRLERVLLLLTAAPSESDPKKAIEVFARAARELVRAELAIALVPELVAEPIVLTAHPSAADGVGELRQLPSLAPLFSGRPVYLPDVTTLANGEQAGIVRVDGRSLRSWLALPILGRLAGFSGTLLLAHHRRDAFSQTRVALASAFAAHVTHALDVSAALEEQRRIAHALQASLLPPVLRQIPGLDLAACYRPSGRNSLVGGDFYDVFTSAPSSWDILLGDASGVGHEAAGLAGVGRYTARALAGETSSPVGLLQQLNHALLRAASDGRFCSAVLARVRIEWPTAFVEVARAGHPVPFVLRGDGTIERVGAGESTILGVLEQANVSTHTIELHAGDALVLYTDGMVEARNAHGELFGDDGLAQVLASSLGRSAEGMVRRLERAVLDHRAARNTDDVAIVVARLPKSAPDSPRTFPD